VLDDRLQILADARDAAGHVEAVPAQTPIRRLPSR